MARDATKQHPFKTHRLPLGVQRVEVSRRQPREACTPLRRTDRDQRRGGRADMVDRRANLWQDGGVLVGEVCRARVRVAVPRMFASLYSPRPPNPPDRLRVFEARVRLRETLCPVKYVHEESGRNGS